MKARVAITPRSISERGHPALELLSQEGFELVFPAPGRQPTERELLASLPGCVGYLAGVEPVTRAVLEASPGLKVISRNGVGVDNIDLEAASALGIVVEKALSANTRGVAELALTFLLCGLRHVAWSDGQLKRGEWKRRKGAEAFGRTLGVVGFGAIGQTVATLAIALGMKVVAHDPFVASTQIGGHALELVPLEDLFRRADVITLHAPPRERPLIDTAAIEAMRNGVVIVNTARAELIDDAAMLAGLDSGKIGAFATDVFRTEPPDMTALLRHENVLLSPHAGGFTEESVDRATLIAVENLLRNLGSPSNA